VAEIIYRFTASGYDTVAQAFKSVHKASQEYGKGAEQAYGQASRAAGTSAQKQVAAGERAAGANERAVAREAKAAEKAEAAKVRAAEKALAHVAKIRERYFAEQQKAGEKAERAAEKAAEKEARAHERALKHVQGVRERYFAEQRRLQERAEVNARRERADTLSSIGGHAFRFLGGAALSAATAATGVVGAAARDSLRLQDASTRISIQSRQHGMNFVDPTALRKEFEGAAAQAPGVTAADIAEGVSTFVSRTGELNVARQNAKTFATVASATGTDVRDVVASAADLFQKFDIKTVEGMRDAFASLTAQGKKGAFELRDAAATLSPVAAAASAFGIGKGAGALRTLGGLTQIARSSTGSAAEAATAVQDMFIELQAKGGKLKNHFKVDVYKDGKARDIRDILVDSISRIGGTDITKKMAGLTEVFGIRGLRAINPLITKYNEAYQGASGTKEERQAAGIAAIRSAFASAIDAAGDWKDVVQDATKAQESTSASLTAAWESVVAQVGDRLVPALIPLVADLPRLAPAIGPAIEAFRVLAGSMGDFLNILVDQGVIKGPSREEKLQRARSESEAFEASIDPMNMTKDQIARRKKLRAQIDRYDVGGAEAAFAAPKSDSMTEDEFVASFNKAQGTGFYSWAQSIMGVDPAEIYRNTLRAPDEARGDVESFTGFEISPKAAEVQASLAEQVTAGRTINVGKGIDGNADEAGKALGSLLPILAAFGDAVRAAQPSPEARASTLNPGGS